MLTIGDLNIFGVFLGHPVEELQIWLNRAKPKGTNHCTGYFLKGWVETFFPC